MLWYIDDVLVICPSPRAVRATREYVAHTLDLLGLQRNPTKGEWEPTQSLTHLGLIVDTRTGHFRLTKKREKSIRKLARTLGTMSARRGRWVPARTLARFIGTAQSANLAIPPARFYLRAAHDALAAKTSWDGHTKLTRQVLRDFKWWEAIPEKWTARPIFRSPDSAYLHCDASGLVGWGGVLNGLKPARGAWRLHQKKHHITLKELKAVRFTVETFLAELRGRQVLLWEDNQAVVRVLSGLTSRSPRMMEELRKLWWLLDVHDISLRAKYIRSAANVWADRLSRERDYTDWMLNPRVFRDIERAWGACTIDRFATANNAQLPRYNSLYHDPGSEATDCLSLPDFLWKKEINWCNPPWQLLSQLAAKLRQSGAAAHVVAPAKPNQLWHRELLSLSSEVRTLPPQESLFFPASQGSRAALAAPRWSVTVFRIEGHHPGSVPQAPPLPACELRPPA